MSDNYEPTDDEWCQCGRRESFHGKPGCLCVRFERSWTFNGGRVKKVSTGRGKAAFKIVADR